MKKSKPKSDNKSSKKDTKKDARKVAQKELGSNLSAKFKEVIEGLGHEAEVIAKDIEKASKFLSKKISGSGKKIKKDAASSSLIKTLDSAIEEVKEKQNETEEKSAVKSQPVNTRRKSTTATPVGTELDEKQKTSSARKPSASAAKASTPAAAKRSTQQRKPAGQSDTSKDAEGQNIKTSPDQKDAPSADTEPQKEETQG